MQSTLDLNSVEDYKRFLAIKSLPTYRITGRVAEYPDEYASLVEGKDADREHREPYRPADWLFDYQKAIAEVAIAKRKYSLFWDCGLGKTAVMLEFAKAALHDTQGRVLIVSPLMVVPQTIEEAQRFYGGELEIEHVPAGRLEQWAARGKGIGITNYEAFTKRSNRGNVKALILDESSMLKSHYGKWATALLGWGSGLDWKLCATGTPAPNCRIEYANHAVMMDHFPTVNAFLATYFVNRGQTDNRWELKPHALRPFYRALSHWSHFMSTPATYGYSDNGGELPPIHLSIEHVEMTDEQRSLQQQATGELFANRLGGITGRSSLGQLGKGHHKGRRVATNKPNYIRDRIAQWDDSTIVWCLYNQEQGDLAALLPDSASVSGSTKLNDRLAILRDFKAGNLKTLITKPKILGFGLNLQICTRQVFSGLQDSYESYYQAVKRSNRIGSTKPLNVHIPLTDVEEPMVQTVLRKAAMVEADTKEQERLFKNYAHTYGTLDVRREAERRPGSVAPVAEVRHD